MQIAHIPLERLAVSKLNVRKHGAKEIAQLATLIRAQGLLQPLIGREAGAACENGEAGQTGSVFEIVAGARRLAALKALAKEEAAAEPVPCVVLAPGDDAAAIEASLAENIAQLPMDELDQYAAFVALVKEGRREDEIAERFGVTLATVRRRLALARLVPEVQRAYRHGEIDPDTLKLLTLATRERQRAYVDLAAEGKAPSRWQLKAWLLGGAEIETRHALFAEAEYTGSIAGDLFGESRYFTDHEEFWRLQNVAIAALRDEALAKGWTHVHVIGPDEPFRPHEWTEVKKADGGQVVIEVRPTGAVETTKGLMRHAEARAVLKARAKAAAMPAAETHGDDTVTDGRAPDGEDEAAGRPELSAPLANWVDLMRLAAVRAECLDHPKTALRLLLAHLLGTATHLRATAEPAMPVTDAAKAALAAHPGTARMVAARDEARAALGLEPSDAILGSGWQPERTAALFDKLLGLDDKAVLQVAALIMAETLALGSRIVDTAGHVLEADALQGVTLDQATLDLVRDRDLTGALLADVIGKAEAARYTTDTGKAKREVILKALAGHNRPKVEGWQPKWLAFPQAQYTSRPLTARTPPAA